MAFLAIVVLLHGKLVHFLENQPVVDHEKHQRGKIGGASICYPTAGSPSPIWTIPQAFFAHMGGYVKSWSDKVSPVKKRLHTQGESRDGNALACIYRHFSHVLTGHHNACGHF